VISAAHRRHLFLCSNDQGCFSHANGDIRKATVDLFAAVHRIVGRALVPALQSHLRPKQMEEYMAAFSAAPAAAAAAAGGPPPARAIAGGASGPPPRAPPVAGGRGGGPPPGGHPPPGGGGGIGGPGGPRGAPPMSHHPAAAAADASGEGEDVLDDGTCQFCGGCGPGATEKQLDLHYWQECPMLMSCERCKQVSAWMPLLVACMLAPVRTHATPQIIEIATRTEHLLRECEHKDEFTQCPHCGDAVASRALASHQASPVCRPLRGGPGSQRCPLCGEEVSGGASGKDGWAVHLLDVGCPANPRTNGAATG